MPPSGAGEMNARSAVTCPTTPTDCGTVSVVGAPGVHAAVTAFAGNGVTVSAGEADVVVLRNLYIAGLVVGSILGMNRRTLVQGFMRMFVPLLVGTIAAAVVGVAVGMAFGFEPLHTFFYIIIPIVGNAAENWAAVRAAYRNNLDLTLSITSGSSTQIPLFVTPVLILVSLVIARPMTLVFQPLELLVLALSTAISAYIVLDGESHWLEGVLLLALYLMTATVFFLDPLAA